MASQISLTYFIEQLLIVFVAIRKQEVDLLSGKKSVLISSASWQLLSIELQSSLGYGYFPMSFSHIDGVYRLSIWRMNFDN